MSDHDRKYRNVNTRYEDEDDDVRRNRHLDSRRDVRRSRLDTLFLTMPISWKGTLAQYVGRLHRDYQGKDRVAVFDYVDSNVPILDRMAAKRQDGYRALGYTIKPL